MSRRFYKGEISSGMKDQTVEREPAMLKGMNRVHRGSPVNQTGGFYRTVDSGAAAKAEKLKRAEESLRTVMYLSCWGPN